MESSIFHTIRLPPRFECKSRISENTFVPPPSLRKNNYNILWMIKFSPPRRARYGTGAHKVHTVRSDSIAQGRETFLGVSTRRDRMTIIPWNPGTHLPVQEVSAGAQRQIHRSVTLRYPRCISNVVPVINYAVLFVRSLCLLTIYFFLPRYYFVFILSQKRVYTIYVLC